MMSRSTRLHALRPALAVLFTVSAILVASGLLFTANRAVAVFHQITETGKPGYLVLSLDSQTPLWVSLRPGDTKYWLVQASLRDATDGTLAVELVAHEQQVHAGELLIDMTICDGQFELETSPPRCSGDIEHTMVQREVSQLAASHRIELARLYHDDPREMLVALTMPATAAPVAAEQPIARVGLGVHSSGDSSVPTTTPSAAAPPAASLSVTGADVLPLGLLSLGLTGLGTAFVARRRHT